jgi:hypothetical protein
MDKADLEQVREQKRCVRKWDVLDRICDWDAIKWSLDKALFGIDKTLSKGKGALN